MPPPTSSDAWLAARRFGIVIDAGSSGSRLQIYSWKDPRTVLEEHGDAVRDMLPRVEKGVESGEGWITKVEPGLSSFGDHPEDVAAYLDPLIRHARTVVPPSLAAETPLFLLATAGMRLLPPLQQARVLGAACAYLRTTGASFRLAPESKDGPCGAHVQIITGEEEGLFGWIAVNYLMDGFGGGDGGDGGGTARTTTPTTYGFLDMGGASTQIAFEPGEADAEGDAEALVDVRLRLLGGAAVTHKVFVTTWLGYGTNQARARYVAAVVERAGEAKVEEALALAEAGAEAEGKVATQTQTQTIPDPCLPKGLTLTEGAHTLRGTGAFTACLARTAPLLNKDAPCRDAPCLFNGVHVPQIHFGSSHFIGVSEYWYSSEHVFGLGGPYDFVQYERAAIAYCARDWEEIVVEHLASRKQLGVAAGVDGDGVEMGWEEKMELSRLQMQCFKAAWVSNVLHEGIGMPRIVDPGGNTTTQGDKVAQQAERKGLGPPLFQSVEAVGDIAISWTLGKMVLEASKEVAPAPSDRRPLVDPVQDISANLRHPPITPIRPPLLDLEALEATFAQHLPPALTRAELGYSPVVLVLYVAALSVACCIALRMRRSLGHAWRRVRRQRSVVVDVEQGAPVATAALAALVRPLRRFTSTTAAAVGGRPRPAAPLTLGTTGTMPMRPLLRHAHSSPTAQYAAAYPASVGTSTSSHYHSRAPSPTTVVDESVGMVGLGGLGGGSLSARSRNASQISLTMTTTVRATPLARAVSVGSLPGYRPP